MADALLKAKKELEAEGEKNLDIIYRAMALALGEDGWSIKRLEKVRDEIHELIEQLAGVDKSVVQICFEETGIDLRPEDAEKGWYELTYLNGSEWDKWLEEHKNMPMKMLRMYTIRAQQKMKMWIRPQLYASIIIAMHRLYGYGSERAARLYSRMYEIEKAAGFDIKKLDEELAKKRKIRMIRNKGERFYFEVIKDGDDNK